MSARARAGAALRLHHRGTLERPPHGLADPAHALGVGREHRDDPEVVQDALGGHREGPHPLPQDAGIAGPRSRLEHVHGRDHREVLGLGADAEGHRRVGGRREHALAAREREQVGGVAAADALDVVEVHGPPGEHARGVGHEQGLVQAVGMDRELHVVAIGHVECAPQLLGAGGNVLVDLEARAARGERLLDALGPRRGCAHQERDVQRHPLERRPRDRQAGGRVGAEVPDGAVVLGDQRRHAAGERGGRNLGREPVHVRVDGPRRDDHAARVHERGLGVEDDADAVHRVRVSRPAHGAHAAGPDADRCPPHAEQRVEHEPADHRDVDSAALGPHAEAVAMVAAPARHDLVGARDIVAIRRHLEAAVAEPYALTSRNRRTPARGRARAPPRALPARPGSRRPGRRGRGSHGRRRTARAAPRGSRRAERRP